MAELVLHADQRLDAAPPGPILGGGGGTSKVSPSPSTRWAWCPDHLSHFGKTPMRAVPDVAMPGDPNTGFDGRDSGLPQRDLLGQYRIGGTSLSSPLFAGVVAVADQVNHRPLGFINPLYYRLLDTNALHDIVAPRSPVAEVRTDYTNFLDNTQGVFSSACGPPTSKPRPCTTRRATTTRPEWVRPTSRILRAGRSTLIACLGSRGVTRRRGTAATS